MLGGLVCPGCREPFVALPTPLNPFVAFAGENQIPEFVSEPLLVVWGSYGLWSLYRTVRLEWICQRDSNFQMPHRVFAKMFLEEINSPAKHCITVPGAADPLSEGPLA